MAGGVQLKRWLGVAHGQCVAVPQTSVAPLKGPRAAARAAGGLGCCSAAVSESLSAWNVLQQRWSLSVQGA